MTIGRARAGARPDVAAARTDGQEREERATRNPPCTRRIGTRSSGAGAAGRGAGRTAAHRHRSRVPKKTVPCLYLDDM